MKITFLVGEEIRPEASGKATVLGLYPDNVVIANIPPKQEGITEDVPSGIDRLTFMVNVSAVPEGTYHFQAQFITPSDTPMGEIMEMGNVDMATGKSYSAIFQSSPFLVAETGIYKLDFYVNGERHQLPFEIRANPAA